MFMGMLWAVMWFTLGCIATLNRDILSLKRSRLTQPMAIPDPDSPTYLHGRHKMEWFWMRETEENPAYKGLSLRQYAKIKSSAGTPT